MKSKKLSLLVYFLTVYVFSYFALLASGDSRTTVDALDNESDSCFLQVPSVTAKFIRKSANLFTIFRRNEHQTSCDNGNQQHIIKTSIGNVQGINLERDVARFTLPYAKPPVGKNRRFRDPVPIRNLERSLYNATILPPPCPQSYSNGTFVPLSSEDCLYLNIYTSVKATKNSNLPVFLWIHGGSLLTGASTSPGLDGSNYAKNSLVSVIIQYRLGLLGFLYNEDLDIQGNMGFKDIIVALEFVKENIRSFGGNPNLITLGGQSSGAMLTQALLSSPPATTLFSHAIMLSSPANYGFHSRNTSATLGAMALEEMGCATHGIDCVLSQDTTQIQAVQNTLVATAPQTMPQIADAMPILPYVDGELILGLDGKNAHVQRHVLMTSAKDDAGTIIGSLFTTPLPMSSLASVLESFLGSSRAQMVINSGVYNISDIGGDKDARDLLTRIGTDYIWRCPVQQFAANWTMELGANIWLAQFDEGIPYDTNVDIAFCLDKVCHQDDIYPTFHSGTEPLTSDKISLENQVFSRWVSFIKTGDPNPEFGLYTRWPKVKSPNDINLLKLNGDKNDRNQDIVSELEYNACGAGKLWGNDAPYDFMLYPST